MESSWWSVWLVSGTESRSLGKLASACLEIIFSVFIVVGGPIIAVDQANPWAGSLEKRVEHSTGIPVACFLTVDAVWCDHLLQVPVLDFPACPLEPCARISPLGGFCQSNQTRQQEEKPKHLSEWRKICPSRQRHSVTLRLAFILERYLSGHQYSSLMVPFDLAHSCYFLRISGSLASGEKT